MPVQTAAGTRISISAAIPATFDAAGYTASAVVFTPIGEIVDGGEHGREYAEVTHLPLSTRGVRKFKGSFNEGSKNLALALDEDDAGQQMLKAARDDDNDYSFEVRYPDGDRDFFQAKVMSFRKATPGADSVVSATCTLAITASNTGIGVVEVPAA